MGQSSSAPLGPLRAPAIPIGVHPPFTWNQEVTLCLKEKAFTFSGDDFSIKDLSVMTDARGNPILNIRDKHLSIHKTWTIAAGDNPDAEIAHVASHLSLGGTKLECTFVNAADQKPILLDLKGNWLGLDAEITLNGTPVARISRRMGNSNELLWGQQTYYLTIAPGVDAALMVAICICLDEKRSETN